MPSDRRLQHGFTLLETLMALAVTSLILGAFYALTLQSSRGQSQAILTYEQSEFARALLDEYITTYPQMATTGNYMDTWTWQIREQPYTTEHQTSQDMYFDFVEVTARIATNGEAAESYRLSRIVARRGGQQ